MIWKDRKYINPRKRVFKNMDTNDILNLELQDDDENIEEESETPLNAHNLNLAQQDLLDDMSKTYVGTSITAPTVAGYGRINKVWGHTIEEGTGEKSPSNPYTLKCVADDVNLFDKSTVTITKYLNSTGQIVTFNSWSMSDYIPCQPQTQYIASGYSDVGTGPSRCYYDKDKNFISAVQHNQNTQNMSFTTPANCYYFIESILRADLDTFKIQKGTVATPYTPFNGEGTVENISKNGDQQSSNVVVTKPLCCLKDTEGNIIAQDYIDYSKGVVHRECGYEVFDGTQEWYSSSYTNDTYLCALAYIVNTDSELVLSNRFAFGNYTQVTNKECIASIGGGAINIRILKSRLETPDVAGLKKWLATNNVIAIFKLAILTTEPIDCSNKIVQYGEQTTVYNRDGAKIEVSLTNNEAISGLNENIGNVENKIEQKIEQTSNELIKLMGNEPLLYKGEVFMNVNYNNLDVGYYNVNTFTGTGGSNYPSQNIFGSMIVLKRAQIVITSTYIHYRIKNDATTWSSWKTLGG